MRAIERRSLGVACERTRSKRRAIVSWRDVVGDLSDCRARKDILDTVSSSSRRNNAKVSTGSGESKFGSGVSVAGGIVVGVSVERSVEAWNKIGKRPDRGKLVSELK